MAQTEQTEWNQLLGDAMLEYSTNEDYTEKTLSSLSFFEQNFSLVNKKGDVEVRLSVRKYRPEDNDVFDQFSENIMVQKLVKDQNFDNNTLNIIDEDKSREYFNARHSSFNYGPLDEKLKTGQKNYFLFQFSDKKYFVSTLVLHSKNMADADEVNDVYEAASFLIFLNKDELLLNAINSRDLKKVEDLLQREANPNTTDDIGQAILNFCINTNDKETDVQLQILETMLKNGADPNFGGSFGTPAIIPAASHNAIKSVELLLKYGADLYSEARGKNALDYARANEKKEMTDFLEKEMAKSPLIKPSVKEKSKLTYNVNFYGNKYQFIIDISQTEPMVAFDWAMTLNNKPNKNGNITINSEALENGYKLYNLFENGEIILDDNTTCVWVSKRLFEDIAKEDYINNIQYSNDESSNLLVEFTRRETLALKNGSRVKTQLWTLENGYKIWVLDDINNRLIMKMDLGWTIEIDAIQ